MGLLGLVANEPGLFHAWVPGARGSRGSLLWGGGGVR